MAPTPIFGVSWWSRATVSAMFDGPTVHIDAADALLEMARSGQDVAVWASREPPGLAAAARGAVIRIEDGFIRSPGLGALFSPAYSTIFDRTGVYYDATGPSDLERLLASTPFDAALLARAARLRNRIVRRGVSKYAVGPGAAGLSDTPAGRARVLVIGQVEDDASIRLGGADVTTNLALLERARAAHPDGYVVFKPHPDVLKAGRPGHVAPEAARRFADAIWHEAPIAAALDWAETVHVISSLAGFEALLRRRQVIVHGRPFYAGWGLTEDAARQPDRRGRNLPLDALVAATLLLYPRYLDPFTRAPTTAEGLLTRIEQGWTDPLVGRPLWHRAASRWKRVWGPLRRRF